jgi:hypothetical protein
MLNRPSTRIDLKLEEDIIELDEAKRLKPNNFDDSLFDDKPQYSPEPNKLEYYTEYQISSFKKSEPVYTPKQPSSSPLSDDISMR